MNVPRRKSVSSTQPACDSSGRYVSSKQSPQQNKQVEHDDNHANGAKRKGTSPWLTFLLLLSLAMNAFALYHITNAPPRVTKTNIQGLPPHVLSVYSTNLYAILGVPIKASPSEVAEAARRLKKTWHPDHSLRRVTAMATNNDGHEPIWTEAAANDFFRRILEASDILTDWKQRARYNLKMRYR